MTYLNFDYEAAARRMIAQRTATLPGSYSGASPYATQTIPQASGSDTYASGISDSGFVKNTCTDGCDDGKIGFLSAAGNALEGVAKGFVNGVTGLLGFGKDANGKTTWNPLKTVGALALGGACILCPALGVIACTVGTVAGGVQVFKGAKAAMSATTDAEAKAAWENMGEGTSTVIGCVLGAKASVGAMKNSSMAAVDDVIKNLDNGDDVLKALKGVDKTNIDDVTAALEKAGINNIDDINNAMGQFGKDTSALGNLDDGLTGTKKVLETIKAFGKDAVSSTKNNANTFFTKVSTAFKAQKTKMDEYSQAKSSKKIADKELKQAQQAYDETLKKNGWTEETYEAADNLKIAQDKQMLADDTLNATSIQQQKNNTATIKESLKTAKEKYNNAQKALKKATKADKSGDTTAQQEALNKATETLKNAKEQTMFGKLTGSIRNTNIAQALNGLKNGDKGAFKLLSSETVNKVASALNQDLKGVWTFLQSGKGTYAEAVQQYGYENVAQVLQVLYSLGQTEQIV